MKVKTEDLIGAQLDWAVAQAEGINFAEHGWKPVNVFLGARVGGSHRYSTEWAQGGPILEREGILLRPIRRQGHRLDGMCLAMYGGTNTDTRVTWVKRKDWPRHYLPGPTPLIAAMRCFVASKLGDEVEIPKELR